MAKLAIPDDPMPAAYHEILHRVPQLLETHDPDLVVHMGLDDTRLEYSLERVAPRQGYDQFPDHRLKTLTKKENKDVFGKAPQVLSTSLDLNAAIMSWRNTILQRKNGRKERRGEWCPT
jgi:pyroglutamyl-peptidase